MTADATLYLSPVEVAIARDRNRSFTRDRCVKVLRRYFNACAEIGRVPSLLGRTIDVSPARTSSRRPSGFEDAVIFSIDIEHCLDELDDFDRGLIVRLVFQEHSEEQAARLLHCCRETISRRLPDVLDRVARILRQRGLLFRWRRRRPLPPRGISIHACDDVCAQRDFRSRTSDLGTCAVVDEGAALPVEILCQGLAGSAINVCV